VLPLLLAGGLFVAFSLIGYGVLTAVRADATDLRQALTAPAIGACLFVVVGFALSELGFSGSHSAPPVFVVLLLGSIAVIAWRRPAAPIAAIPVIVAAFVGLTLVGLPFFDFGFRWVANGNDDMANYVLSATRLWHHAYSTPLDAHALASGLDYSAGLKPYQAAGARPGSEMLVALVSGITGRPPLESFMPTILALYMGGVASAGALALQATDRRWAAWITAAVVALSPLSAYGVLQQLIAQVFGLLILPAIAALLMRKEVHQRGGARVSTVVPLAILAAAMWLVYPELASLLVLGYLAYVAVLLVRRELSLATCLRLWIPVVVMAAVVLGPYTIRGLTFLTGQSSGGLSGSDVTTSLFAFMLLPTALPGALGLQTLNPPPVHDPLLNTSIVAAAVLLVGLLAICIAGALRARAAATLGVVFALFGALLALRTSDFGLFKLVMYAVPVSAAATAGWMVSGNGRGRYVRYAVGGIALAVVIVTGVITQQRNVADSRDPITAPQASEPTQLAAFKKVVNDARGKLVVSAFDNIFFQKTQGAIAEGHPLQFLTRDPIEHLLGFGTTSGVRAAIAEVRRTDGWIARTFSFHQNGRVVQNAFQENVVASRAINKDSCTLVVPTSVQSPFNGRSLPPDKGNFITTGCDQPRNLLAFVNSAMGQHYTVAVGRFVSFYQLEPDPYHVGDISAFGRYALFRVLGGQSRVRVAVDMTSTLANDADNRLPPAAILGNGRTPLPVEGRGSARVVSAPVTPQVIDGVPYIMVDMGRAPTQLHTPLTGVANLWSKGVSVDTRFSTVRLRDISLISDSQYAALRPPAMLSRFPSDLTHPDLQYSGIYEDGFVGPRSYAVLRAGANAPLHVAGTLGLGGVISNTGTLTVLVDGHVVREGTLSGPNVDWTIPVRGPAGDEKVELRFSFSSHLPGADMRPASAQLTALGFVSPASSAETASP
jgi:hypothetical protein